MVLKLFNLLAIFLGLDCTVLLTHLHNIPGITKVAISNFCFCLPQAYPLSSLLLKELLRGSEMSSDLLSGTCIAGYMFTKPIFIRCNCSSQKCVSAEYVCMYVCMCRVGNGTWLKTCCLKPFLSSNTLMLLVLSSSQCIRHLL